MQDGFGRWFEYADVPDEAKVWSPDRKLVACWYISRHRVDRFDDDTEYHVVVWDTATVEEVARLFREYNISRSGARPGGTAVGRPIAGIDWSPDGASLVIRFEDGAEERVALPGRDEKAPAPEAAGVESARATATATVPPPSGDAGGRAFPEPVLSALARAAQERKPVLVHFVSAQFGATDEQRQELATPAVAERLRGFVVIDVDYDREPDVAEFFEADSLPELRLFLSNGIEARRIDEFIGARDLAPILDEVAARNRTIAAR